MESRYAISYVLVTVTCLVSCTVSEIWRIIDPIVTVDSVACV